MKLVDMVPSFEDFSKLHELKVAKIVDGCWVYHGKFEETVYSVMKKGISRFKQASYGRKVATRMTTTILAYDPFRESRKNIENLVVAYVMLDQHLKRLRLKTPKNYDNLVYATWYLNDHKPEATQSD